MRKRILLAVLLFILALPTAGLFWLLYSETGLRLALSQLDRLGQISIRVDGVTGRLAGPLSIRRFELRLEHLHVVAEDAYVELQPQALLAGIVQLRKLSADRIEVQVDRSTEESAKPPRFLPGNLRLRADDIQLKSVNFVYADVRPYAADSLSGSIDISRQRLRAERVHIVSPEYMLDATVDLRAREAVELNIAADGSYALLGNVLQGHAELNGVPASLQATAQLTAPSPLDATAKLEFGSDNWKISGSATSPTFDLKPWWRSAPFGLRDTQLTFSVDPQLMKVNGALAIPELGALPLQVEAEGNYRERTLRIQRARVSARTGAMQVDAAGEIHFAERTSLQANASWRGLAWPLAASPSTALVFSDHGELHLNGGLPYEFSLQAELGSARLQTAGTAQLSAQGTLTTDALNLSKFQLSALDGVLDGSGQLAFAKPQIWSLQVTGRDLNPVRIHSDLAGRIRLRAGANGRGLDKNASFAAQVAELSGTLRGQPLNGRGGVEYTSQVWRARQVELGLGSTQLRVDGSIGRQWALDGELRSDDLRTLDIGAWELSGRLNARMQAQGPMQTPRLVVHANSEELKFGEWQGRKIDVDADVDFSNARETHIDASAERVVRGEYALDTPRVVADGLLTRHRIDVSSGLGTRKSTAITLKAAFEGGYAQQSWSGNLLSAALSDTERERARVPQPVRVQVAPNKVEVGELCVAFDESRDCAQGFWERRGPWRITASVDKLPLALFNTGAPESLRYEGQLAAKVDLGAANGEPWWGKANAQLSLASITYFSSSGRYESLPIGAAHMDLVAADSKLTGTLAIEAGESTRVTANAEWMQDPNRLITQWPMQSQLNLHSMDAKLLPLLFANLDRVSGVLDANMQATGNLAQPQLRGSLQLQQGEADVYQLNLALRQMNFLATLEDNRLKLEGSAHAGEGVLDVKGNLAWNDSKPSGTLHLKGDKLLVSDLPEYRVVASPDLTFSVDDRRIDVVGDIVIPSAKLQPQNLSGAVQTSSDARLLTDQQLTGQSRWTIWSEVRISMGDDVQVDALGLQGKLIGSVGTTFHPGDQAIGRGELSIQKGLYEAYGRKLDIKRGRLLFEAAPVDDPGLDVQAERQIEDTTVGVNVRGTLRSPRLQFYSDPSMSQTEIVSYLLIGKPLDQLQGSETTTVRSASNTLAVQGGGFVAAQLGRRIGLEQVGVETDSSNQSSLVLGKFLSPRLFVSYGISLTQAINTLKMRYTLNDHWVFKTEAGNAQSADLELKIER